MPSYASATSAGELLAAIRGADGLTRQELLASTGMSRSTLYHRLDQLQTAGCIYESHRRGSTGGRPATVLSFDDRDRVVLTIDIGHHRAAVSVCDLAGSGLAERVVPRVPGQPFGRLVAQLGVLGEQLLMGAAPATRLLGVGLAIPTPVNTHTGRRLASVTMPNPSYPIAERLAERFKRPVSVENDARALALGAATEVEPMDNDGVLLGVKYSTGIGVGVLTGGQLMRGSTGAAGDLGHLRVTPDVGPECTCGRRGCLAAYVAGRSLVRDLGRPEVTTVGDLVALYDVGDADVMERVHEAARLLGQYLGGLVQVANPQYVAFGGFLGGRPAIAHDIVAAIRERVADRIGDVAAYRVVDGDHTTASGLVALVLDSTLAPDAVNQALAHPGDALSHRLSTDELRQHQDVGGATGVP